MMIQIRDLVFEYPGHRALHSVSLTIAGGAITALVGPNGAGKTTLLRCMAALDQPVGGAIRIGGLDVLQQPRACHRVIGYLSDFFGLYQRLTVRQCLHYVARAQGMDSEACATAIEDASRRLHIGDRLDKKPGELSRGLRQRLAIAQAIIHQPQVLLLDEPASGLDPEARHELDQLFLDLQAQGMTLVVSSHILESYCTDMLVLRQGRIVEQVNLKHASQSKVYKLLLAWPVENLSAILQNLNLVNISKTESNRQALLQLPGEAQQQHHILKALLAQDLPVCEFAPAVGNLQDAYLQTVRQPA